MSNSLDTFPRSVLYLLAAPSTPDAVREEIIERAEAGELVSVAGVKQTIAEQRALVPIYRVPETVAHMLPPKNTKVSYPPISSWRTDSELPTKKPPAEQDEDADGPTLHISQPCTPRRGAVSFVKNPFEASERAEARRAHLGDDKIADMEAKAEAAPSSARTAVSLSWLVSNRDEITASLVRDLNKSSLTFAVDLLALAERLYSLGETLIEREAAR